MMNEKNYEWQDRDLTNLKLTFKSSSYIDQASKENTQNIGNIEDEGQERGVRFDYEG